jgi:hypothetical protein
MHILTLFSGHSFLGGRAVAHKTRTDALSILSRNVNAVVVLDFDGVSGVSHSFCDELLSPLADLLQEDVVRRVKLSNCTVGTLSDLSRVAEMHALPMPSVLKFA